MADGHSPRPGVQREVCDREADRGAGVHRLPPEELQAVIVDDSRGDTSEAIGRAWSRIEFVHLMRPAREGFKAWTLQPPWGRQKGSS